MINFNSMKFTLTWHWPLATLILVILNLTAVISLSWLWVFAPLWAPIGLVTVLLFLKMIGFRVI